MILQEASFGIETTVLLHLYVHPTSDWQAKHHPNLYFYVNTLEHWNNKIKIKMGSF